jgi:hypothetical protein
MFCPILHLGSGRAVSAQLAEILAAVQYRPFNVRVLSSNGSLSQDGSLADSDLGNVPSGAG